MNYMKFNTPPSSEQDEDKVVELLRLHLFDTQNQSIDRLILYIPGPSWLGLPPDRQSKAPRGPRHGLGNVDYAGDARSQNPAVASRSQSFKPPGNPISKRGQDLQDGQLGNHCEKTICYPAASIAAVQAGIMALSNTLGTRHASGKGVPSNREHVNPAKFEYNRAFARLHPRVSKNLGLLCLPKKTNVTSRGWSCPLPTRPTGRAPVAHLAGRCSPGSHACGHLN